MNENSIDMQLLEEIKSQVKIRLIDESLVRIKGCLDKLTEDEVWQRPNENSNSMGNLVLHLCGNLRQWYLSGLGGYPDNRKRQEEFDEKGPVPKSELIQNLEQVLSEVTEVTKRLTLEDLIRKIKVQGYEDSGLSIIIHVIEHFSYHVGQMAYYVKAIKDLDLGFYSGKNLDETNN